ncbi:hypothetical protein ACFXJ8_43625 [Nonomuraea sp. NPDC059194]|uniref:hypothetical protein n=1 Tax=Nonomuraea sp. NPDC059194 TaxID=3346764 RepID=UPI0036CD1C96
MTPRAAEITRDEITAERHAQSLKDVRGRLASSTAVRALLVQRIRLQLRDRWPTCAEYWEPVLEIRDPRGCWRATITISSDEFAVRLPGGTVHVQRPEQAALLAEAL